MIYPDGMASGGRRIFGPSASFWKKPGVRYGLGPNNGYLFLESTLRRGLKARVEKQLNACAYAAPDRSWSWSDAASQPQMNGTNDAKDQGSRSISAKRWPLCRKSDGQGAGWEDDRAPTHIARRGDIAACDRKEGDAKRLHSKADARPEDPRRNDTEDAQRLLAALGLAEEERRPETKHPKIVLPDP